MVPAPAVSEAPMTRNSRVRPSGPLCAANRSPPETKGYLRGQQGGADERETAFAPITAERPLFRTDAVVPGTIFDVAIVSGRPSRRSGRLFWSCASTAALVDDDDASETHIIKPECELTYRLRVVVA